MTRIAMIHAACLLAAVAIGYGMGLDDAAKSAPIAPAMDPWGTCTPEAALDDPATWAAAGKGGRLDHTCLAPDTPPDPQIFARAYGYDLSAEQWAVALYRLILAQGGTPFVPIDDLPSSPVPLPMSGVALLGAISAVVLVKTRILCHRQRDRGCVNTRSH